MDLTTLNTYSKQLGRTIDRNSPTILTALGVAGLLGTVILAVKATPKAMDCLEYERAYRSTEVDDPKYLVDIDTIDTVKVVWKEYIPAGIMGAATIACMIGSNHISLRRNAALVSLLSLAETTLREYQAKVVETIGDKKAEKIESDLAQDRLDKQPAEEKTVIITGKGDYLCFDTFSSRYFRSNIDAIQKLENQFNQKLLREGWLNINELYYELGLDSIPLGDEFGWIAERNLMELKFHTKQAKDSGEPCLVIDYRVQPHHI